MKVIISDNTSKKGYEYADASNVTQALGWYTLSLDLYPRIVGWELSSKQNECYSDITVLMDGEYPIYFNHVAPDHSDERQIIIGKDIQFFVDQINGQNTITEERKQEIMNKAIEIIKKDQTINKFSPLRYMLISTVRIAMAMKIHKVLDELYLKNEQLIADCKVDSIQMGPGGALYSTLTGELTTRIKRKLLVE
ncbi:MAG: hypothetical protein OXE59_02910 [Bacteroidetes bacterium]|nr:hypothetical protein [Bacteroidota bacterium]